MNVAFLVWLLIPMVVGFAESIRPSALAGQWYARDESTLRSDIQRFLGEPGSSGEAGLHALIVPHAGYRFSGASAGAGYASVRRDDFNRVIILAPSHYGGFAGASIGSFDYYETPLGRVPVDRKSCDTLLGNSLFSPKDDVHTHEHAIEIQLPFLQEVLKDFRIVPILIGQVSFEDWRGIATALSGIMTEKTLIVVSSDFTHYGARFGYQPFHAGKVAELKEKLRELDMGAVERIVADDPGGFYAYVRDTGATICGRNAIGILLELLDDGDTIRVIDYRTSLDVIPDVQSSVSYCSIGFFAAAHTGSEKEEQMFLLPETDKAALLSLARETVRARLEGKAPPDIKETTAGMSDAVNEPAGVFVTLTKRGYLRGCIGYIEGFKPLIEAVADNAISAAFRDPRFPPVSPDEWDELTFKVSVLTPLEPVNDISEIEVGRHGLVLSAQGHRGVFLPEVPVEQGWDLDTYLRELGRKAGLDRDAWKEGTLERFESIVFGDPE